jgi:two-component system CheB/CheR fusion protein
MTPEGSAQAYLSWIVESSNDAIIGTKLDGTITSWNHAAERIFGYTAEEVIGRQNTFLAAPGQTEDIFAILDKISRGERVVHYETQRCRKDGEVVHVSLAVSPIRDETGMIVGASKIARDITEKKRIESLRAELIEKLKRAAERKDEFLVMLAHELRNPLAPLRNAVHLLRLRGHDPATVERVGEIMDRQISHMGRLIDDLLDVSEITRGKVTIQRERLDLAHLARLAWNDHRQSFESFQLALTVSAPETPVWVQADATRMAQVIDNLLENARKFTEAGGQVDIVVEADPKRGLAVLRVRDTGIGVEPEILPLLFEVFSQADRSLDRGRGGLGLGLALVKRIVGLHGGKVHAQSQGAGRGSEFVVELPIQEESPALRQPGVRHSSQERLLRVLVVEDNRDSAESLRLLISMQGHDVNVAFSGLEGVAMARKSRPDVVICDLGLPGLDGFGVAQAIRKDPLLARAKLIAVTGYGRFEDEQRAIQSGFDTHLVKPADPERLLQLLN